ncbi:hypothetical protein GOODEAATRI_014326 [Goodea atripinnis]|uniref:Peptide chain release factor domain-containing protein n=1 Tax=Goodea atripinnis TaxID=208336 RepID=A0ABV0P4E7_9TELE
MMKLLSVDELFAKRSLQEHLQKVEKEYNECLKAVTYSVTEDGCSEDEMKAKRTKISLLAPLIQSIRELDKKQKEISETEMLLKEYLGTLVLELLIPEEEADMSDLVLEVTAGVGGQEAMLFTAELFVVLFFLKMFDMYEGFAQYHGWSFDVLEHMSSDLGGLRHASASISGLQSYKKMKFEAGVHRVQRVPKTEKQGRMHTSTMTVAIGTRGRSEKIRTYNYAQDRITDHRISMTVHDVKSFLLGEDLLNEMNSSLQDFSNQETLMELLEEGSREEP